MKRTDSLALIFLAIILFMLAGCGAERQAKTVAGPEPTTSNTHQLFAKEGKIYLDSPFLYVFRSGTIFRRNIRDDNSSWMKTSINTSISGIAAKSQEITVIGRMGIWHSTFGISGLKLTNVTSPPFPRPLAICASPTAPQLILALVGSQLLKSSNYGATWTKIQQGKRFSLGFPAGIRWNPSAPGQAWIYSTNIFGTGLLWVVEESGSRTLFSARLDSLFLGSNLYDFNILDLAFENDNPETVYLLTNSSENQLFKSADGGNSWINPRTAPSGNGRFTAIAGDFRQPQSLFLLDDQANLYHSADGLNSIQFVEKLDSVGVTRDLLPDLPGNQLLIAADNGVFSTSLSNIP